MVILCLGVLILSELLEVKLVQFFYAAHACREMLFDLCWKLSFGTMVSAESLAGLLVGATLRKFLFAIGVKMLIF